MAVFLSESNKKVHALSNDEFAVHFQEFH